MRLFRRAYWWCYIVVLSARWMFQTNLGDKVRYRGKTYEVFNGIRPKSWRLLSGDSVLVNDDDGWVSRAECRKVRTVMAMIRSWRSGYDFYMGNWYSIWVADGIEPWVKSLDIWPNAKKEADGE